MTRTRFGTHNRLPSRRLWLKRMALEEVVPWSIASTYLFLKFISFVSLDYFNIMGNYPVKVFQPDGLPCFIFSPFHIPYHEKLTHTNLTNKFQLRFHRHEKETHGYNKKCMAIKWKFHNHAFFIALKSKPVSYSNILSMPPTSANLWTLHAESLCRQNVGLFAGRGFRHSRTVSESL